jgi:DNA-binding MarR family transcriptional regulator
MDVFTDSHTHSSTDADTAATATTTAQRLMRAFMQFGRAEWHQRSIMGYKPSEIRVLFCIKKGGKPGTSESTVSEISKLLHVTSPTVTQLIKGLEAEGLIERTTNLTDRRVVGIKLTEKGEEVTQRARKDFLESINGLIEYLGEEQSEQLAELLLKAFNYYKMQNSSMESTHWNGDSNI